MLFILIYASLSSGYSSIDLIQQIWARLYSFLSINITDKFVKQLAYAAKLLKWHLVDLISFRLFWSNKVSFYILKLKRFINLKGDSWMAKMYAFIAKSYCFNAAYKFPWLNHTFEKLTFLNKILSLVSSLNFSNYYMDY